MNIEQGSRRHTVVLVFFALIILLTRLHSYRLPASVDVNSMQTVGHELLRGRQLYTEIFDHHPPLSWIIYALSEILVGWGPQQILLLGTSLSIITMVGVYAAAIVVAPSAGLLAAGFWTIIQSDLAMEAQHPNVEAFINACLVWAFLLILRGRFRWAPAILFGIATLLKNNAIAYPACLGVAHILGASDRRSALRDVGVWLGVGLSMWGGTALWFTMQGRWEDFWISLFIHNMYYSGSVITNIVKALLPPYLLNPVLAGALPAAALCVVAFRVLQPDRRRYFAAALVAAWLAVLLPGQFYEHYYQLYLPFLATGAGIGGIVYWHRGRIGRAALVVMIAGTIAIQLPAMLFGGDRWIRMAYGRNAERYLAQYHLEPLVTQLAAGGGIYSVGSQTAYTIHAQTPPPTSVIFLKHLTGGPAVERLKRMVMADLERNRPAVVVYDSVYAAAFKVPEIESWIARNYRLRRDLSSERRALIYTRSD